MAHFHLPLSIMTDSYKAGHFEQYPDATQMVAYGEFRAPFQGLGKDDKRLVFYGIRYLVENYIAKQWTEDDVEKAALFYSTHNSGFTSYPFPKELFLKFVKENNGYIPVKLEALPEGTVAHVHTPVYQITAEGEYSKLVTFLETILTHVWYPTTVATLSRRCKELIEKAFEKSVDPSAFFLLDSRLHDFGFRGCTCGEQSVIGGTAHLLNFRGSDTMSACYYAQFHLNGGKPVAQSIPATEHSVMTSWETEEEAIRKMIDKYGSGVFACVLDSYDYSNCLNNILPKIAEAKKLKGGFMVLRPDSGDPVEVVMEGLRAADKVFGHTINSKGFKVLNGAGVIQGDGINIITLQEILDKVLSENYSAQNVAFGMGGGLLQKVNRDTMSFATKLAHIKYATGVERDIMKYPKTDSTKVSHPGVLAVYRNEPGNEKVYPVPLPEGVKGENLLRVVYDKGPVPNAFPETFDEIRDRVEREWKVAAINYDPSSEELAVKTKAWVDNMRSHLSTVIGN